MAYDTMKALARKRVKPLRSGIKCERGASSHLPVTFAIIRDPECSATTLMHDLITDLEIIRQLANEQEDENIRFRQFLKYRLKWSDRKLDAVVGGIVRQVEAAIDCTQCANCCRVLEVSLETDDVDRLANHLAVIPARIEADYTVRGKLCDRAFAQSPCAFLADNRCTVYPARPRDCREYPHLGKGQFRERMWQILSHAEDCPIVFNVLQRMKRDIRQTSGPLFS